MSGASEEGEYIVRRLEQTCSSNHPTCALGGGHEPGASEATSGHAVASAIPSTVPSTVPSTQVQGLWEAHTVQ